MLGSETMSLQNDLFSNSSDPITDNPNESILLPNDYKYYHNYLDKSQFNLILINSTIYSLKLLYKDKLEINLPNLRFFIIQTLKRSKCSISILQISCFYLMKLIKVHDDNLIQDPKKLFLGLLILSSKFSQDCNFSFKSWIKILCLKSQDLIVLKSIENNLLQQLDYNLYINELVYENWCNILLIFGYDFIKMQRIIDIKSEITWISNNASIDSKLLKWKRFFDNLNLSHLKSVNIKFSTYYLNQFNSKVFIVDSLFKKRNFREIREVSVV